MATKINSKVMLPVVAVLLAIKFVMVPVVGWQNDMMADIEQRERRNIKAQRLLNSEEQLLMQLVSLSKSNEELVAAYPRYETSADFHIETKMMFDMLLKQFNFTVTQFFWRDSEDKEVFPGMHRGRFNVDFNGKFKDFALLQARLNTTEKAYRIVNFSAQVKNQSAKSAGTVDATFTIETYYWLGGQ